MLEKLVSYNIDNYIQICRECRRPFIFCDLNNNVNGYLCDDCFNSITRCQDCGKKVSFALFDGNCCIDCTSSKIIKNYNCRVQNYLSFLSYDSASNSIIKTVEPTPKTLYYGIEFEVQIRPQQAKEYLGFHNDDYKEYDDDDDDEEEEDLFENSSMTRQELANRCWNRLGKDFAIIKHDGSVGYGFEIVTAPATLEVQKRVFKRFLEWFRNTKAFRTFRATECGIHIHVSRDALSPLQIGKIISFVHSPKNDVFMYSIAQRYSDHYANWKHEKKVSDVLRASGNKYEAINLNNEKTIEFRIFQSDSRELQFMKNLEFVQALIDFSSVASIPQMKDFHNFVSFIKEDKCYPYLNEFCKTEGTFKLAE
jgi:hypothetical protein